MVHQSDAGPTGRQNGPAQGFVGKAVEDAEDMLALIVQGGQEKLSFPGRCLTLGHSFPFFGGHVATLCHVWRARPASFGRFVTL